MTKCPSLDGLSPWEVVLMEEDTTTTLTLLSEDAIGLFLLIFMFPAALQLLRLYCMDSSNCRRRSIGARTSSIGGLSEIKFITRHQAYFIISNSWLFYLTMNHPLFGGYSVDMLPYSVCFMWSFLGA